MATRGFTAKLGSHSDAHPNRVRYTLQKDGTVLKEWLDRKVGPAESTLDSFHAMLEFYRREKRLVSVECDTNYGPKLEAFYDEGAKIQWFYDPEAETLFRVPFADCENYAFAEWDFDDDQWKTFRRIQLNADHTHEGISEEYAKNHDHHLG